FPAVCGRNYRNRSRRCWFSLHSSFALAVRQARVAAREVKPLAVTIDPGDLDVVDVLPIGEEKVLDRNGDLRIAEQRHLDNLHGGAAASIGEVEGRSGVCVRIEVVGGRGAGVRYPGRHWAIGVPKNRSVLEARETRIGGTVRRICGAARRMSCEVRA